MAVVEEQDSSDHSVSISEKLTSEDFRSDILGEVNSNIYPFASLWRFKRPAENGFFEYS